MRRAALAAAVIFAGCAPHPRGQDRSGGGSPIQKEVWEAIRPQAAARGLDPYFVYALVGAESAFDPRARRGRACGLLQLKAEEWRLATDAPFEPGVWDWRRNLDVGLDRLGAAKALLEAKGLFSYRRLWAIHHFGLSYVAARDYEIERTPRPDDPIGRALWLGEGRPLTPPN